MSKAETIDALMESATLIFAADGYEGASLRDIARNAGVPLSTIHLYFGSKSDLFGAIRQAAWTEVNQEREGYLDRALSRNAGPETLLADTIHALAFPVARRALSQIPRDKAQIFLLRAHWNSTPDADRIEISDRTMLRWVEAIQTCYPTLSRLDVAWALSFAVGAIYSWQLLDHRYDRLIGVDVKVANTAEEVTADVVAFCCSGIRSMVERRGARQS